VPRRPSQSPLHPRAVPAGCGGRAPRSIHGVSGDGSVRSSALAASALVRAEGWEAADSGKQTNRIDYTLLAGPPPVWRRDASSAGADAHLEMPV
jgi:hypothetical protein